MTASDHFAQTYAEARGKFVEAARAAGLALTSHPHPLPGRDGETLALDVARFGADDAESLLILSSGCHGVEGFCGSGAQVALLRDPDWHAQAARAGVAVLYLHALNPHGFSFWRRTTHENVDLNRNFRDYQQPLPRNAAYDEIAHLVVPAEWPPNEAVLQAVGRYVAERGMPALQAAISTGQHDHANGLFFAGRGPTWSHLVLRQVLRAQAGACRRLGWIDFHTGLGPTGHGERIHAGRGEPGELERARRWWGEQVTSIHDGSSTSAAITGQMTLAVYDECPGVEFTAIAMEYGTVPLMTVMDALRADQWLQGHPEAGAEQARSIKQQIRDAFYTDTDAWKERIVAQAREAAAQAAAALRSA
jgi:Protein of unknown function (DUF2817)